MPILNNSSYKPAPWLRGRHLQTIVPNRFRYVRGVVYLRERIDTPDQDFLDLDWSRIGSARVAIVTHGLEGCTIRPYVKGMVKVLNQNGWDALAWNLRGRSGELNKQPYSYHSGKTEDLQLVIQHALRAYQTIALIGFSLGGNLTLKYLGEQGDLAPDQVKAAITFSVPCDLRSGSEKLGEPGNWIYLRRFLRELKKTVAAKSERDSGLFDAKKLLSSRNFREFDDRFTAPINGFRDADDYYEKCSCCYFLCKIRVPSLIVNARNDPFLGNECYPTEECEKNEYVTLEIPDEGGHVGFPLGWGRYWSEDRAIEFLGHSM